ncbi:MAG: hypothetical protein ACREL7_00570 [Longimicrobiales bacterium]
MTRVLIWDFDGTLATRIGGWTDTLCEVIARELPGVCIAPKSLRPYLQSGFPWHSPKIVRAACSPDAWWERLEPVFASALMGAGLDDRAARRVAQQCATLDGVIDLVRKHQHGTPERRCD